MTEMPNANFLRPPLTRILLLEDSDFDADLITEHLSMLGREIEIVRTVGKSDYTKALTDGQFDVVLADFSLPGFSGVEALQLAQSVSPTTPFIFVSGILGEEVAIDSFRRGATDYVLKQRLLRLPTAVERALEEARLREERRRAEAQTELLVRELSHRVKNTLAVVASIVRNTARHSQSASDLEERLLGRIHAMSDAHSLLFETNWTDTSMFDIVDRILKPYMRRGVSQIRVSGDHVELTPNGALVLGMILYELATNASKYGALTRPEGTVHIEWTKPGGREVELKWTEAGGPPVTPPEKPGFGTTLIQRSAGPELGGEADLEFDEKGVRFCLRFPLGHGKLVPVTAPEAI